MQHSATIRAMIIDDESSAIEILQGMLGQFCPQVTVVAEASNIQDALEKAQTCLPDLVFLDIELPPFSKGFEFVEQTRHLHYGVVFTTAYSQYAVEAINSIQPWGYLLKPYRVADLVKSVQTALEKIASSTPATPSESTDLHRLVVPDNRLGKIVLPIRDILFCASDRGTSDVYFFRNGKVEKCTASRSLKELGNQLPASRFCRCHHKYLVNLEHIIRYKRTGRNGIIIMPGNHDVAISVMKMDYFEARLKQFLST